MTTFGDGMLLGIPQNGNIRIFKPPIALPDLQFSLMYETGISPDAGRAWFLELIKEVARDQEERKKALYESLLLNA